MFTSEELAIIQKLYGRKTLSDEEKELLPAIQEKLNADSSRDVAERFRSVTGWANPPKDYPI